MGMSLDLDHPHDHAHDGDHSHDHSHGDDHGPHEAGLPPAGGPVMVDIGDDVGALIVATDPAWLGRELHVRRGGDAHTTHTGVWERRLGGGLTVVAVFPQLAEGRYDLLDAVGEPMLALTITGGRITELDLRQ
jgi:hypothetical protein